MLLEPLARDTGAAVCGAAVFHRACGAADDVLLILPADHLIRRTEAFLAAVAEAAWRTREGHPIMWFRRRRWRRRWRCEPGGS